MCVPLYVIVIILVCAYTIQYTRGLGTPTASQHNIFDPACTNLQYDNFNSSMVRESDFKSEDSGFDPLVGQGDGQFFCFSESTLVQTCLCLTPLRVVPWYRPHPNSNSVSVSVTIVEAWCQWVLLLNFRLRVQITRLVTLPDYLNLL